MRRNPLEAAVEATQAWQDLVEALRAERGRVLTYVIGGVDRGKTTLCRYLCQEIVKDRTAGYVDGDPGQPTLGPPTTLGMTLGALREEGKHVLRFVGSTSPPGHLLQMLAATKWLAERTFRDGAEHTICDSPGFTEGDAAREYHYHLIDLLRPSRIVAVQQRYELEPLLACFTRGPAIIHRLSIAPAVTRRTPARRRANREAKFRGYFRGSRRHDLPLASIGLHGRVPERPGNVPHQLIGILGQEGQVLVLGIGVELDDDTGRLALDAPPFDPEMVGSVQFGSLYVDRSGRHGSREEIVAGGEGDQPEA